MAAFFQQTAGKAVAVVLVLLGVAAIAYEVYAMHGSSLPAAIGTQVYIDAKTDKPFDHKLEAGEVVPVTAPSGGKTGFPAELCYWTADGQAKTTPDPVLLNGDRGKAGPTFCPVCHRLVVHHNPTPAEGAKLPPTQAQYEKAHGGDEQG